MPTPDGRAWLTSTEIMSRLYTSLQVEFPNIGNFLDTPEKRDRARNALRSAFVNTGYVAEFKLARMFEKVLLALEAGNFGPVDAVANPNIHALATAMRQIFSRDFMDGIDEDGNEIP